MDDVRITMQGSAQTVLEFAGWLQQKYEAANGITVEVAPGGEMGQLWLELPSQLVQSLVDTGPTLDPTDERAATDALLLNTPFLIRRLLDSMVPFLNRLSTMGLDLTRTDDGHWVWGWLPLAEYSAKRYKRLGSAIDDAVSHRVLGRDVGMKF